MYDKNFEILETVYGKEAYYYIIEWMMDNPNFHCTPAQAAAEMVKEEGFDDVATDPTDSYLSDYDRNSGMF